MKTAKRNRRPATALTYKENPDISALNFKEGETVTITFKNTGYAERNEVGEVVKVDPFKSFPTKDGKGFDLNGYTKVAGYPKKIFFQIALHGPEVQEWFESGYYFDDFTGKWTQPPLPEVDRLYKITGKFELRTIDLTEKGIRTKGPQLFIYDEVSAIAPLETAKRPERPDLTAAKKATNKANAIKNAKDDTKRKAKTQQSAF